MSVAAAVAAGRRAAEARMTSRVTIYRLSDRVEQDEESGREVPVWEQVATDVLFRLDGASSSGTTRTLNVGGIEYQQATAVGHLPIGTDLADHDWLEVTSGEWSGSVYRVVEATQGDQKTARRVPIVAEERPEEWW